MAEIEYTGKTIQLDEEGFLVNFTNWSEDVAKSIAWQQGIGKLSEEDMEIIRFLRENFQKFKVFPILYYVCKNSYHPNQCFNEQFMNPDVAWKIAGLPKLSEIDFVTVESKHYRMEVCRSQSLPSTKFKRNNMNIYEYAMQMGNDGEKLYRELAGKCQ